MSLPKKMKCLGMEEVLNLLLFNWIMKILFLCSMRKTLK